MYTQSITRKNRTLFVVAIDQSGSMAGMVTVGQRKIPKADMVTEVANDLLAELVEMARRSDGLRDYYDVALVGYSDDTTYPLLPNGQWTASIVELDKLCLGDLAVDRECKMPDGSMRIITYNTRRWITPKASGSTPMYEALLGVDEIVEEWVSRVENRDSFAPQIINITDGESTDCDYIDIAEIASKIKSHSTRDGNALLFNVHIASDTLQPSLLFPSPDEIGCEANPAVLSLYNAASDMPDIFFGALRSIKGCDPSVERFKAMSFNASVSELVTILNIGTISIKRR